jgi:hypothetical protein
MLDNELLATLLAGKRVKKAPTVSKTDFAILRDGSRVNRKDVDTGVFYGKQGSARRSRKGRTYRAPNGFNIYIHGDDNVLAYKV